LKPLIKRILCHDQTRRCVMNQTSAATTVSTFWNSFDDALACSLRLTTNHRHR